MISLNSDYLCDPNTFLFVIFSPLALNNYEKSKSRCEMWDTLVMLAKEEHKNIDKYSEILNLKLPYKVQVKIKNLYRHNKQYLEYLEHLIKTPLDSEMKKAKG